MPDALNQCSQCGGLVEAGKDACPQCGTNTNAVWPPPPSAFISPAPPPVRLFSGTRWGDIGWGVAIGLVFPVAWVLLSTTVIRAVLSPPFPASVSLGSIVLYFAAAFGLYRAARPRYPVFAHSLSFMFLLQVVPIVAAAALYLIFEVMT